MVILRLSLSFLAALSIAWASNIFAQAAPKNTGAELGGTSWQLVKFMGGDDRTLAPGDKTALEVAERIKAPVLGLYGGADSGIPVETLEKLREALKGAGNNRCEFVVYPDTPHGFHADYRPSYRKGAAEDGWKRCLAWFGRTLV